MRYYSFIGRLLAKLADILSISVRYEKMFEKEQRVQVALKELYLEVLLFLQRLRVTISGGCMSQALHFSEYKGLIVADMLLSFEVSGEKYIPICRRRVPEQCPASLSIERSIQRRSKSSPQTTH